jgi:hypothetical protein
MSQNFNNPDEMKEMIQSVGIITVYLSAGIDELIELCAVNELKHNK